MTTVTVTTKSGATVTAELIDGDRVLISQDRKWAGSGRLSAKGRIDGCDARLGAPDGSESEETYEALEEAFAAAPSYFVVPAPGYYGNWARVMSSHSTLAAARRAATWKGVVVRKGELCKGAEWLSCYEETYPEA